MLQSNLKSKAETQLEAINSQFDLDEIKVFSRSKEKRNLLVVSSQAEYKLF